jgi:thioredoxin-like negative regulator of GroEL
LLQRSPEDTYGHIELASVLLQRGQLRAATEHLLQVARMPLDDSQLIVDLVRRLYFSGEIVAARGCLDNPVLANQPAAPVLAAQAQLRWLLGEIPPALTLVEQAIAAGADAPDVHYLHAMLLQYTGHIERAAEVLVACVGRWPRFGDAAVALANLRRQTTDKNHLELLQQRLAAIPVDSAARIDRVARAGFESALFKVFDDLDRPAEAWPALERSNALMHALTPYDAAGEAAGTGCSRATRRWSRRGRSTISAVSCAGSPTCPRPVCPAC